MEEFVAEKGDELKLIIIDGESINSIDSSGIYMLNEIIAKYKSLDINIAFTGMKGPVRDVLEKSGVMEKISYSNCYMSIQDAVEFYELSKKKASKSDKFKKYVKQTNK